MKKRRPQQPTAFDGIIRHPGRTFVARSDIDTFERLTWDRFDDPGVGFGFWAVTGDDGWTYHFGNRNLLDLAMTGAENPTGPWREISRYRTPTVGDVPLVR